MDKPDGLDVLPEPPSVGPTTGSLEGPHTPAALPTLPASQPPGPRRWAYPDDGSDRDLRIDFIRGMVLLILFVNHIDFFSLYNFVVWERLGVISGGEGFVILSGFVIGMVYRRKLNARGWQECILALFDRAAQLYRVNIGVAGSVVLLGLLPWLDLHALTTFTDRGDGQTYPLFPELSDPLQIWIARLLLLQTGPHQIQILGLYVLLLVFSPVALWFLRNNRTPFLLALSWILYCKNWASPAMPTGAQFEYGFPVLTWQLLYFHGMAVGFKRDKITEFLQGQRKTALLVICSVLFLGFMFFAQNSTNSRLPAYAKMSLIPAEVFDALYSKYFLKNSLGILRLVNYFVALVVGYTLLTHFWVLLDRALGWFFVPLGQATLYAFIVHIYIVLLLSNLPLFWQDNMWMNTAGHTLALLGIWWMIRNKFLFRWIPR